MELCTSVLGRDFSQQSDRGVASDVSEKFAQKDCGMSEEDRFMDFVYNCCVVTLIIDFERRGI